MHDSDLMRGTHGILLPLQVQQAWRPNMITSVIVIRYVTPVNRPNSPVLHSCIMPSLNLPTDPLIRVYGTTSFSAKRQRISLKSYLRHTFEICIYATMIRFKYVNEGMESKSSKLQKDWSCFDGPNLTYSWELFLVYWNGSVRWLQESRQVVQFSPLFPQKSSEGPGLLAESYLRLCWESG